MKYTSFILLLVLVGCKNTPNAEMQTTQKLGDSSLVHTSLTKLNPIRTQEGKEYQVYFEEDTTNEERGGMDCSSDDFMGKDRSEAKTSFVTTKVEAFATIEDLFATLAVDERVEKVGIKSSGTNARRINVEQRNVQLNHVSLYAIKREADNDFHLIIGNRKNNNVFLNAEISGLPSPNSPYYTRLSWVRKNAENIFGEMCTSGYYIFNPPIPTILEGSLFFDIDHKDGTIGPKGMKPITAWEIHPVTNIGF